MFCKKCGAEIPDGSVICPSCGTATGAGVAQTSSNTTSIKKSWKKTALLVLGIICILSGLYTIISSFSEETLYTYGLVYGMQEINAVQIVIALVLNGILSIIDGVIFIRGYLNTRSLNFKIILLCIALGLVNNLISFGLTGATLAGSILSLAFYWWLCSSVRSEDGLGMWD